MSSQLNLCLLRRLKSFQRGTVGLCRSTGCKVTSCQSWWMIQLSRSWPRHTDWFQKFFSNNSLFWRYNLELSNSRFVWPYIYLKSPRNFRKPHGKFSEPFYFENTKFRSNIMTDISTFFGLDFSSHWIPLNFCLKYLCN